MFVRVFLWPDSSDVGRHARLFVDLVIELGMSLTLVPVANLVFYDLDAEWAPYKDRFMAMVQGPYVNVVSSNVASEWARLWTTNLTNVIVTTAPPPESDLHIVYQGAFQAVILPEGDGDLLAAWQATPVPVLVLPRAWTQADSQAIRDALLV